MKRNYSFILLLLVSFSTINAQWVIKPSGTNNHLLSVDFADSLIGYASGYSGLVLKSVDGGNSWTTQNTGTSADLYANLFLNADTGFVAGDNGVLKRTYDGGASWNSINVGSTTNLRGFYFLNSDTGFVVGGYAGGPGYIFKTTNGGTAWQMVDNPQLALYSVWFTDNNNGYAVGQDGVIRKTVNGGSTWIDQASGVSTYLLGVSFTDALTGYACGENGVMLKTVDAGTTWIPLSSGSTTAYLTEIEFATANLGYAVGGNTSNNTSTIYKTINAGSTWTLDATSTSRLYSLDFLTPNTAVVVGLDGVILKNNGIPAIVQTNKLDYTNVFPNPFNSKLTIELNATETVIHSCELYDISGRSYSLPVVIKNNEIIFNTESLSRGIYFIRVSSNEEHFVKKIIKQ